MIRRQKPIIVFGSLKLYTIISVKYVEDDEAFSSCIMNHYIFIPLLIPNNFRIFNDKIHFYNSKV